MVVGFYDVVCLNSNNYLSMQLLSHLVRFGSKGDICLIPSKYCRMSYSIAASSLILFCSLILANFHIQLPPKERQ